MRKRNQIVPQQHRPLDPGAYKLHNVKVLEMDEFDNCWTYT